MRSMLLALALAPVLALAPLRAGAEDDEAKAQAEGPMASATFGAFEFRNIGPAFTAGRIADIAIVPDDPATWYVGVGSGGVWKTTNAGTTWTPVFDKQDVYSIGSIALDPSNPHAVWVGTGENVGGRHISWGDGIYLSLDGGKTWENKGLAKSEHISTIIVHPDNSDVVFAASQGPLWSSGGDRGLYKTTDGGETWKNVLSAGEWTGVTDVVMDPRDPDRLYAATWQHHRTVAAYMGGGPESGIHMSDDGGETWTKLAGGLPGGNLGKIGLAISPIDPDVVYAAIELDRREGGVWRSADRGASWTKMSDAVGGGTGPHYYQEIYASPHAFDRLYLVSNYSQVSEDGGKTFRRLNNNRKHVDDHAVAFRPDDPDYILFGSDGGLYETYDLEKSWRFINNLPVTQYYKVAVDDAAPFYNVYGGTQDNNSHGGPSRTDNINGIRNSDWFVTLFGDGHQSATEPGNPNIMYAQWQQGNLVRVDRTTGEIVYIQPQPAPGDAPERFNWDAPIVVSSHDPKRLYHASQRLWRSDDRGDSWTALSGDLTRNEDRLQLPIMGRKWSWDAPWDILAMSKYNTITSIGESAVDENLLYAGTDDGLLQMTEDGGQSWTSIPVTALPGVPEFAFVNDIKADLFERDTVYVALDNHKYGDYKPYLFKSTDKGKTWTSLAQTLPEGHLVWRIVQDHEQPNLLFAATEFGVFFSVDGGTKWVELNGGVPTISFRDLAIQRRENDLVGASFGRGFFILDDYSPLRSVSAESLEQNALLFPGRKAWWYIPQRPLGGGDPKANQGDGFFTAPNPPFGAVFTYYLKDGLKTLEAERQETEKPLVKDGKDTPFPGFERLEKERRESAPQVWLTVRDADGNVVRRLSGPTGKGFHRIAWDLSYPAFQSPAGSRSGDDEDGGFMAPPGTYTVSLSMRVRGETMELVGPKSFEVVRMREGTLDGAAPEAVTAFWERLARLQRSVTAASRTISSLNDHMDMLKGAIGQSRSGLDSLEARWKVMRDELFALEEALDGKQSKDTIGELKRETVRDRLSAVTIGTVYSTYGPTKMHLKVIGYAEEEFEEIRVRLNTLKTDAIPDFEAALIEAGGPWVPGSPVPPAVTDL